MCDTSEIIQHIVTVYDTECVELIGTDKIFIPAGAKKTYTKQIIHRDNIDIDDQMLRIDNAGGFLVYLKHSSEPMLSNRGLEKLALDAFMYGTNTVAIEATHTTRLNEKIIDQSVTTNLHTISF